MQLQRSPLIPAKSVRSIPIRSFRPSAGRRPFPRYDFKICSSDRSLGRHSVQCRVFPSGDSGMSYDLAVDITYRPCATAPAVQPLDVFSGSMGDHTSQRLIVEERLDGDTNSCAVSATRRCLPRSTARPGRKMQVDTTGTSRAIASRISFSLPARMRKGEKADAPKAVAKSSGRNRAPLRRLANNPAWHKT
jgi:hypothetical protein